MFNKKKRAKFIDFQKKILTPFCKKGLGQPAKKSLMSGFKDGGGVIVPGYLEFTGCHQSRSHACSWVITREQAYSHSRTQSPSWGILWDNLVPRAIVEWLWPHELS